MTEPTTIEKKEHRFISALVPEEARMMANAVRDFVDMEIMPIRRQIDPDTRQGFELIRGLQKKLVLLGSQKTNIPEEYGGLGVLPLVTSCLQAEEFARGDAAFIMATGVAAWSFLPATLAGNKAILDEFAPKLCGDEPYIACFAMTEPGGGCNIEHLDMRGRGIATRATLDDVRVPKAWRVAGPGRDAELFHNNLVYGRIGSAAPPIGCAQGAFEEVLAFTKDRLAAGKPIRQHSIAANILADMAIGIQVGRDAYINAAYMYDHPETYGPTWSKFMLSRASIAKVFCCDVGVMVTNKAMELMGSYGYVTDHNVEKYWRDVKIMQLWEGGAQLGRLDVVRGYYDYNQFYPNQLYEKLRGGGAGSG